MFDLKIMVKRNPHYFLKAFVMGLRKERSGQHENENIEYQIYNFIKIKFH